MCVGLSLGFAGSSFEVAGLGVQSEGWWYCALWNSCLNLCIVSEYSLHMLHTLRVQTQYIYICTYVQTQNKIRLTLIVLFREEGDSGSHNDCESHSQRNCESHSQRNRRQSKGLPIVCPRSRRLCRCIAKHYPKEVHRYGAELLS